MQAWYWKKGKKRKWNDLTVNSGRVKGKPFRNAQYNLQEILTCVCKQTKYAGHKAFVDFYDAVMEYFVIVLPALIWPVDMINTSADTVIDIEIENRDFTLKLDQFSHSFNVLSSCQNVQECVGYWGLDSKIAFLYWMFKHGWQSISRLPGCKTKWVKNFGTRQIANMM